MRRKNRRERRRERIEQERRREVRGNGIRREGEGGGDMFLIGKGEPTHSTVLTQQIHQITPNMQRAQHNPSTLHTLQYKHLGKGATHYTSSHLLSACLSGQCDIPRLLSTGRAAAE